MYLAKGSLLPVVEELAELGWCNKRRTTKHGKQVGGRPFDKATLYALLTNPIYVGKIRHKAEFFDGEHEAILPPETFAQVQDMLQKNGRRGGADVRNQYGALLRGLLHCKACGCAMTHNFTSKRGKRCVQYRYYTCIQAIKRGRKTCPAGSLPAAEIERVVVDEIRDIINDPAMLEDILQNTRAKIDAEIATLNVERKDIKRELGRHNAELRKITVEPATVGASARIADLNERIDRGERRLAEIDQKVAALEHENVDPAEATSIMGDFDNIWSRLSPREQARVLSLLVDRVEYDANEGTVSTTLAPAGIKAIVETQIEDAA